MSKIDPVSLPGHMRLIFNFFIAQGNGSALTHAAKMGSDEIVGILLSAKAGIDAPGMWVSRTRLVDL